MNYEIRYNDVKKNEKVLINLRFYSNAGDLYLPVYVTALKPTETEIKKYGTFEYDGDDNYGDGGIHEFCRINLTKWKLIGAPKETLDYVKGLIGKTIWSYFNGAECAWKFFDPDGDVDEKNADLYFIKGKITDEIANKTDDFLEKMIDCCYAPHRDTSGNYGDESVHAVYDMKCDHDNDCGCNKSHFSRKTKLDIARNLISKTERFLENLYKDLDKKHKNHKRIEVDSKMIDDLRDYIDSIERIS